MDEKLQNGFNTGVLVAPPKPSDFMAGAETGIVFEERISDGNWETYKPTDEWQRRLVDGFTGYDTLSCVTFSALNSIESQIYFLIKTGAFTETQIDLLTDLGYIDENGRPNFNDWFTAVMSGTTINGNYLIAVWDSIRKDGLLPQAEGYKVNDFTTVEDWLAAKPTEAQKEKAKKILDIITVAYEWIVANFNGGDNEAIAKHLKHAPIHVLTPTGGNWNTTPPTVITDPKMKSVNHATLLIGDQPGVCHKDLDHYNPFVKFLAFDYYIPYAIKGVVMPKKETSDEWSNFHYTFNFNIYAPAPATDVKELQTALQKLGYMKKGVYGPFGPQTIAALKKFQADNGIIDNGTHFGPKTRVAINSKLN